MALSKNCSLNPRNLPLSPQFHDCRSHFNASMCLSIGWRTGNSILGQLVRDNRYVLVVGKHTVFDHFGHRASSCQIIGLCVWTELNICCVYNAWTFISYELDIVTSQKLIGSTDTDTFAFYFSFAWTYFYASITCSLLLPILVS